MNSNALRNENEAPQPMAREPISAFVITFNEQENIGPCLESLSFCDEVIVIDSFSTDETISIAKAHGAQIIQRPWPGYRDQKAFGLSQVANDWVLNIDADERVSKELRESIEGVLSGDNKTYDGEEIAGYYINRVVFYLNRWWRSGGWYPEYRLRLFRAKNATWGGRDPHEKPIVDGKKVRLEGELQHFTYHDLDDQFNRMRKYSTIAAREEFKERRPVNTWDLVISPFVRVFKFYVLRRGYREGLAGIIVAGAEGFYTFMKYAKLWEHYFNEKNQQDKKESD